MLRRSLFPTLLPATVVLSGCAGSSDRYPSLEIRDAERVSGSFEVAQPVEPVPLHADIAASLPEIEASARAAHADFLQLVPSARQQIDAGKGTAVDSNAWALAQIALADLESHRSTTAIVLGDLDLLYADATLQFAVRESIAETRNAVLALIAEEDRILRELSGS